jgi:hypothetical protein
LLESKWRLQGTAGDMEQLKKAYFKSMQHLSSIELIKSDQKHVVGWTMPTEMKIRWTKKVNSTDHVN